MYIPVSHTNRRSIQNTNGVVVKPLVGMGLKGLVINYGEGGATKWENRGSETFCGPPPPQDSVKLFAPPLLISGNFTRPPYNMAKTSSYRVKTTPKLFVPPPPSEWLKLFLPPLFVRVKLHVTPLPFCSPPLPIISDQSLTYVQTPRPSILDTPDFL